MDFLGEFPALFAKLAPLSNPNISQKCSMEINMTSTDGGIQTRQVLGKSATQPPKEMTSHWLML